jgi:aspartyl-tRNA(Asn)/glutamyl-tRNA(Gln) amidotransferase subunit C
MRKIPAGFETLTARNTLATSMSDATVDTEEVEHVAGLARVDLDGEQRERFAAQFDEILEAFEALDEVPEVEPDPELTNVMRADEVEESLDREEALRNAAETEDGRFKGPRVS